MKKKIKEPVRVDAVSSAMNDFLNQEIIEVHDNIEDEPELGQLITEEKTSKTGRKKKIIDWEIVKRLCEINCTLSEVASFLRCSVSTVERRLKEDKNISFSDFFDMYAGFGRMSIRRMQFKLALQGNTTMLIFLGKQYLGQRDNPDPKNDDNTKKAAEELNEILTSDS